MPASLSRSSSHKLFVNPPNHLRWIGILAKWFCLVALSLSLVGVPRIVQADSPEYAVKAAYLFNFAKYIEWPTAPPRRQSGKFVICSWKTNSFEGAANELEKRPLEALQVVFRTVHAPEEIPLCDVLFFTQSVDDDFLRVSSILEGNSVVSVTERSLWGILNFQIVDEQVRFDCNLTIASRTKIRLSSQLLKLAQRIEGEAQ